MKTEILEEVIICLQKIKTIITEDEKTIAQVSFDGLMSNKERINSKLYLDEFTSLDLQKAEKRMHDASGWDSTFFDNMLPKVMGNKPLSYKQESAFKNAVRKFL